MSRIRIQHFSDALCIWAYVAEVRCTELERRFPDQIELDYRFFQVFGDVAGKIRSGWHDRGGHAAYSDHVRAVAAQFEHVQVHEQLWRVDPPRSSLPAHLLFCAVRELEQEGKVADGSLQEVCAATRRAFFQSCADISRRSVLLEIAASVGIERTAAECALDDGTAAASLSRDLELARELAVRASPTLVFNEGRQRLTGNVGYRILEANVRELLERPAPQQSWC